MDEADSEQEALPVTRQTASVWILILYTLPFLLLNIFAYWGSGRWTFLCLTLLLCALGTFAFHLLIHKWEFSFLERLRSEPKNDAAQPSAEPDYAPYIQHIEALQQALQEVLQKQEILEKEKQDQAARHQQLRNQLEMMEHQREGLEQEYAVFKHNAHEQLEHHKGLISDHQRTIGELRDHLEKRQQHIQQLESKTRDLNYELKTLLQIAEKPVELEAEVPIEALVRSEAKVDLERSIFADFVVHTHEEAHVQLKRCLDIAQRIVGASHFGGNARFRELTLDNFALDLRRLFDSLSEVNAGTVFVYTPKEDKVLFVNDKVKDLLGITPEKFTQSFHDVIEDNLDDWQGAVRQLAFKNESKLVLSMKSRSGQEVQAECLLGVIPTGIFRSHAIGLIYQVKKDTPRFVNIPQPIPQPLSQRR